MNTTDSIAVFAITYTVLGYYLYYFIGNFMKTKSINADRNTRAGMAIYNFLISKITGLLFLGLIPAMLLIVFFEIPLTELGVSINNSGGVIHWVVPIIFLQGTIGLFSTRNPDLWKQYPEMRVSTWTIGRLAVASGGWILYLSAYEFLFRGVLLVLCLKAFGQWPAIAINLSLYSALHLTKGWKETLGAIPFGALLCYLTISSGSLFPAFLVHLAQALSTEILCIRNNPNLIFHPKLFGI